MMKMSRLVTTGMVSMIAASVIIPVAAFAASEHAVSGTVYSGCSGEGPWYTSSIARTKSGTGPITLEFSQVNTGGKTWMLLDSHNAQIGTTESWGPNETNYWQTLASNVSGGTVFYNSFRDTNYTCPSLQSTYNFAGTEYY
jgi:hypothetical protein